MRPLLSALSSYLLLIIILSILFQRSKALPTTLVNETIQKRESSTATPPPSTIDALLAQLKNPAEVLTVLLLIGGDVVQKAIAQVCGRAFTPVSFSFGWVGYAFSALMTVFGDGLIMPESDITAKVIDVDSGNCHENESWVLGRLIRDMELAVERHYPSRMGKPSLPAKAHGLACKKGLEERLGPDDHRLMESPLLITKWKATAMLRERIIDKKPVPLPDLPQRDYIWWSYIFVAILQHVIAAVPMLKHGRSGAWRVLFITGAGNILALITGSLEKWKKEKFACRMVKGPKTYVLTRGNGHRHAFVIQISKNNWSLSLEDLAVRQRNKTSKTYQATFIALTAAWILLLIIIGGLPDHTWFLFGVGLLGMAHNVLVAGLRRDSAAHGIPLELIPRNQEEKPKRPCVVEDDGAIRGWKKNNVMRALIAAETAFPGIGSRLLPIFFPGDLRPGKEEDFWNKIDEDRKKKRQEKAEANRKKERQEEENAKLVPGRRPEGDKAIDIVRTEE